MPLKCLTCGGRGGGDVTTDSSLTGDGSPGDPLSVANIGETLVYDQVDFSVSPQVDVLFSDFDTLLRTPIPDFGTIMDPFMVVNSEMVWNELELIKWDMWWSYGRTANPGKIFIILGGILNGLQPGSTVPFPLLNGDDVKQYNDHQAFTGPFIGATFTFESAADSALSTTVSIDGGYVGFNTVIASLADAAPLQVVFTKWRIP